MHFISILFLYFSNKKINTNLRIKVATIAISIFFLLFLVFFIKPASSTGRIFIYKISYNIFEKNYFSGIGSGKFPGVYGQFQAHYFQTKPYTKNEFLNADNVFYAFNDYLQFSIEQGIFGATLIVVIISMIYKMSIFAIRVRQNDCILKLCVSFILMVLCAAFTTHTFDSTIILIFLSISLGYIFLCSLPMALSDSSRLKYLILLCLIIWFLPMSNYFINLQNSRDFKHANDLASMGYILESKSICDELWPKMKDNQDYLLMYCNSFEQSSDPIKYAYILNKTLVQRYDYTILIKLGRTYEKLGRTDQALKSYLAAVNLVPNRFKSRFTLFEFYLRNHQLKMAKLQGNFILQMPVKINSIQVEHIKREVKNMLNTHGLMTDVYDN
ncbi:O-antigen ligase family protein [Pedobacter sp. BG31]|uniref:O-antigen ligase family protein n=1 Tax=Pedobacter sp. BG31 TaxID=3349697 RepID=UPI0035F45052